MESKKQTLSKLKLNKLSENELDKRSMKAIKGGCSCNDGCKTNTSGLTELGSGY